MKFSFKRALSTSLSLLLLSCQPGTTPIHTQIPHRLPHPANDLFNLKITWQDNFAGYCEAVGTENASFSPASDTCYNSGGEPEYASLSAKDEYCFAQENCRCLAYTGCRHFDDSSGGDYNAVIGVSALSPDALENYPELTRPVFSPRSGKYPQISFQIETKGSPTWELSLTGAGLTNNVVLKEGSGESTYTFDGYKEGICLRDGTYTASLDHATQQPNTEFYIDNTPPLITDLELRETFSEETQAYESVITFTVKEPEVNGSYTGVIEAKTRVFIDDSLYSFPIAVIDDNFWLTGLVPESQTQIEQIDDRTVNVTLTLPYRFTGHTLEVEVEDFVGNEARYLLNPEPNAPKGENA